MNGFRFGDMKIFGRLGVPYFLLFLLLTDHLSTLFSLKLFLFLSFLSFSFTASNRLLTFYLTGAALLHLNQQFSFEFLSASFHFFGDISWKDNKAAPLSLRRLLSITPTTTKFTTYLLLPFKLLIYKGN